MAGSCKPCYNTPHVMRGSCERSVDNAYDYARESGVIRC